ncbi:MAG: hypothetical protein AAF799_10020 [Myxococcota bacterium]
MLRRIGPAFVLGLVLVGGCNKGPTGPVLHPAASDTVTDQGTAFKVDVAWRSVGPTEAEIIVKMTAQGIETTDNLVVDVKGRGFVITNGGPEWIGIIQPREKYEHKVSYKLLDDSESGAIEVTIRRSHDSTMLWNEELLFRKEAAGLSLAE